ncbi:Phospholipase_D-nuclease N-terminal [Sediminibacillus albus]|uniref:Phospholipase_D-nuclease N-terminal n=2 Tax=Sediminibacillus albus TaxID=407036 RepID=A0A1G8WCF5_9BACI|nr:PLDc N-terminal domain-containing protein [Sediminibacillus albus]SDJ75817.1 Phospholipase_D-nuclease N-terminal [Sediminibacillus albus]
MIFILFIVGLFFLNIFTSIWAYKDAVEKGRSREFAVIVLVATLFFPVVGLIVYLFIREI